MKKTSIFSLFLLVALVVAAPTAMAANEKTMVDGNTVSFQTTNAEGFTVEQKNIGFANQDFFWSRKITFSVNSDSDYISSFPLAGTTGTARYYDRASKNWKTVNLADEMPLEVLFIETDKASMILNPCHVYKSKYNTSVEACPQVQRAVSVTRRDGDFLITLRFPQIGGTIGEVWGLQSSAKLVPWDDFYVQNFSNYFDVTLNRWLSDGYYRKQTNANEPYSANMFWRCPANWVPNALMRLPGVRAAEDLAWAMADTLLTTQTPQGFWFTGTKSNWLANDYKIGAWYYDTRFNCDFLEALMDFYQNTGHQRFLNAALRGADYLIQHATENSYVIESENLTGWLVQDYSWPGHTEAKPTVVALNHQIQELKVLYKAYRHTHDKKYIAAGQKLLNGITLTRDSWIRPDGNLHYGYLPDGTYGREDYPELVYNDMLDFQRILVNLGVKPDPDIQVLMDTKRAWMDKNGVKYNA